MNARVYTARIAVAHALAEAPEGARRRIAALATDLFVALDLALGEVTGQALLDRDPDAEPVAVPVAAIPDWIAGRRPEPARTHVMPTTVVRADRGAA